LFLATDAPAYEHFMARWSRRPAGPFLDFAGIKGGNRVLDVGCGTGVITAALAERGCTVIGLDASEPYLEGARRDRSHPNIVYELERCASHVICGRLLRCLRLGPRYRCHTGGRSSRPRDAAGPVDTVASSVVDFWGGFSPADLVCDTASVLDEGMRSVRDQRKARPIVWANGQAAIWRESVSWT
jgi:SAM-dependent methyltransferase